jgi:hypothetical protein
MRKLTAVAGVGAVVGTGWVTAFCAAVLFAAAAELLIAADAELIAADAELIAAEAELLMAAEAELNDASAEAAPVVPGPQAARRGRLVASRPAITAGTARMSSLHVVGCCLSVRLRPRYRTFAFPKVRTTVSVPWLASGPLRVSTLDTQVGLVATQGGCPVQSVASTVGAGHPGRPR